jgi:hypothetical protein
LKKGEILLIFAEILRIELSNFEKLFVIPIIGLLLQIHTHKKGVLCILIIRMLKFRKIKLKTSLISFSKINKYSAKKRFQT